MSLKFLPQASQFLLIAALMVCIGGRASAQEQQVGVLWTYSHSPGTGHKDGLGVSGEIVLAPQERLRIIGKIGTEWTAKSYLGNGRASRGDVTARYGLVKYRQYKLFGQIGGAVVNNTTSDYSKTAWFVTAGAGVSFDDLVVVDWRHFFRENQTLNKVKSDKINAGLYLPFDKGDRWVIRVDLSWQRTGFYQPFGNEMGNHIAHSMSGGVGVGIKF